jgi:hypothetical protein
MSIKSIATLFVIGSVNLVAVPVSANRNPNDNNNNSQPNNTSNFGPNNSGPSGPNNTSNFGPNNSGPSGPNNTSNFGPNNSGPSGPNLDLTSVVNGLVTNIISPPHRVAEIQKEAEIAKEKIKQETEIEIAKLKIEAETGRKVDRVIPTLTQWGVSRVNCAPGVAAIKGISSDTVCITPTAGIPAGSYNYNSDRQQLVRINDRSPKMPAATANISRPIRHTEGF